jgi:endonuclease YncB( thermonuclease family)
MKAGTDNWMPLLDGRSFAVCDQRSLRVLRSLAALTAVVLSSADIAPAADLTGQASIIDGDTLEIHGTRIRLWGIDAPESTQLCRGEDSVQYRCGAKSANDLDAFIAGQPVNCIPIALDRYGRTVATCSIAGAARSSNDPIFPRGLLSRAG